MLSVELKSKITTLWDKFWSRGIANPITAIEQISYLLFLRRIDDTDLAEKGWIGKTYKSLFLKPKLDKKGNPAKDKRDRIIYENMGDCRWSNFNPDFAVEILLRLPTAAQ